MGGGTTGGSAEVHSGIITSGGSTYSGGRSGEQSTGDKAKEQAQQLGHKASDAASQAKQKAGDLLSRAEQKLDQSGVLDKVRDNALPAVGIAFGIGFLLAGGDGDDEEQNGRHRGRKSGSMNKAKHQLKGAVMGGLSATVAQEARSMLGMAQGKGSQGGGMLSSLLNNLQGGSGGGSSSQGSQASESSSGGSTAPYDSTRSAGTGTY